MTYYGDKAVLKMEIKYQNGSGKIDRDTYITVCVEFMRCSDENAPGEIFKLIPYD